MVGALSGWSERLFDLPAAEATGADADTLGRSIHHGTDSLEVGIEGALRLIVGVTDVMARLMFL